MLSDPCFCFSGEVRRARRGGHIPGAVNTPYRAFLAEGAGPDGSFRVFKDLEGIKEVGNVYVSRLRPCVACFVSNHTSVVRSRTCTVSIWREER